MNFDFGKAAQKYDEFADIQSICANKLSEFTIGISDVNSIIDIGAGTGLASVSLLKYFPNAKFTLCDISKEMIDTAKTKIENCNLIVCDAQKYNFIDSYDICVSNMSLQWFSDLENFLNKISKNTRYILFSIPLKGSFENFYKLFPDNEFLLNQYKSLDDINKICKNISNKIYFETQSYFKKFENPYKAAVYFRNIGSNVKGKSENASVFFKNKSEIIIEYKVLFMRLEL